MGLLDNAAGVYTSGRGEILAVDRDGTLWSMNSARFDGLVPGCEQDWENAPLKPLRVMEGVSMAAMGQFHSVILKRDGSVWVQGAGSFGAPWLDKEGPYLVEVLDNAVWVCATADGGLAVTDGHELWAWGLAAGDADGPVKLLDGVIQADGQGPAFTLLTEDGSLLLWGEDGVQPEPLLAEVVRCGAAWAIREDGALWTAGVGLVDAAERTDYTQVMEDAAWAAQGENSLLVLDRDGALWLVGRGEEPGGAVQTRLGEGFGCPEL